MMLDSDGTRIGRSRRPGAKNERLRMTLDAGTYYVNVEARGKAETRYRLRLKAVEMLPFSNYTAGASSRSVDLGGNTLNAARNLGTLTGAQQLTDRVGADDRSDYYQFALSSRQAFNATLSNLTADADLRLFDHQGILLQSSIKAGSQAESVAAVLNAGTYRIQVSHYQGNTSYALKLNTGNAPAKQPNPRFNATTGYGQVDAAAVVAAALGRSPFANGPDVAPTWNVDQIKAPEVWNAGFTGRGVTVAVVDSGVDYHHPDLKNNIWRNVGEIAGNGIDDDGNGFIDDVVGWDFVSHDNTPTDPYGHGTHVAGIIAAERNSMGMTGVAPDAKIMPVRIGNSSTQIAAGIRYAVNNGADVINLSVNGSFSSAIQSALFDAVKRGTVVVLSAGNTAQRQPSFPAQFASDFGIAVGAVDAHSRFAAFSNRAGAAPLDYVVAPGVSVRSTLPNHRYGFYSGTSMAAPHVAAIAALALSANPRLTPAELERLIVNHAVAIA